MSPAILRQSSFSVYIYSERGPHKAAHCHVRRKAGGPETVIGLPSLKVLIGSPLSSEEREVLVANLQKLLDGWEELNG